MPDGLVVMWVGVAIAFAGFAAKWTDRTFGLSQLIAPEVYEWIGTWAMRLGIVVIGAGGLLWLVQAS